MTKDIEEEKMEKKKNHNVLLLFLLTAVFLAVLFAPLVSQADTHTYSGANNGLWNVTTNWNPNGIPAAGDTAIINEVLAPPPPGGTPVTVRLRDNSTPALSLVQIDNGCGLNHTQFTLTTGTLELGVTAGKSGTYNLAGTGILSATSEYIGSNGTGTFIQNNGTRTNTGTLYLGYNAGASGSYTLTTGNISSPYQYIGFSGTGAFTQNGGASTVTNDLNIAQVGGSTGSYGLTSGTVTVSNFERIGNAGTGSFTQSGGTHTVNNTLVLGEQGLSTGTYNLSGTGIVNTGRVVVGSSGKGDFYHSSGTHTVTNDLVLGDTYSGNGIYNLSGTGILSAGSEVIGASGVGTFNQTGGSNTVANTVTIGTGGTYMISVGTLTASEIINNGSFVNTGGGVFADVENYGTISGTGTFTGNVENYGKITPGTSIGTLTIVDGDYFQGPDGLLLIQIADIGSFDFLNITGSASLSGELDVDLLFGFDPLIDSSFDILHADNGISGTFSALDLWPLSGGKYWDVDYLNNDVVLNVRAEQPIPEPSTFILVGAGLVGIGLLRKRFKK